MVSAVNTSFKYTISAEVTSLNFYVNKFRFIDVDNNEVVYDFDKFVIKNEDSFTNTADSISYFTTVADSSLKSINTMDEYNSRGDTFLYWDGKPEGTYELFTYESDIRISSFILYTTTGTFGLASQMTKLTNLIIDENGINVYTGKESATNDGIEFSHDITYTTTPPAKLTFDGNTKLTLENIPAGASKVGLHRDGTLLTEMATTGTPSVQIANTGVYHAMVYAGDNLIAETTPTTVSAVIIVSEPSVYPPTDGTVTKPMINQVTR